jgi:hypothetical protein
MNKQEKEILNRIYVTLESIAWRNQTIVVRDKWREAKIMFEDLDISLVSGRTE